MAKRLQGEGNALEKHRSLGGNFDLNKRIVPKPSGKKCAQSQKVEARAEVSVSKL